MVFEKQWILLDEQEMLPDELKQVIWTMLDNGERTMRTLFGLVQFTTLDQDVEDDVITIQLNLDGERINELLVQKL